MSVTRKILWAIDPFEQERRGAPSLLARSQDFLKNWTHREDVTIELAYLLSPLELNIAIDVPGPQKILLLEKYREAAEQTLDRLIAEMKFPQISERHVLIELSSSLKVSVERMASFAEERKADFIMVASHGRKGLQRLLLGSFAESLLLHSHVPTLVIGGHGPKKALDLKRIVFATDLGAVSRSFFEEAVKDAKNLGSELLLYHALPNPVEPVLQSGMYLLGGGWVPMHQFFAEDASARRKQLADWADWAKEQGTSCRWVLEETPVSITDAIVHFAESNGASLISLASQSGPVVSALIGSVVRQVVRQSSVPVLVLHTTPKQELKARAA